ncbi:hypothetical protein GAYE_SCF08G3075 [Galdieria yellowstonensis]|uniref:Major facilitator superfamily (MFS) profile domain-containing protein n=1 Tax=Galdieria yellowstonensis TaxID=3028027 RepID=A0AAV9ICV1_9RHOD|nr:hypothetical protein GAYE_SCF08G3075 [Galdieria yellowstonensis]
MSNTRKESEFEQEDTIQADLEPVVSTMEGELYSSKPAGEEEEQQEKDRKAYLRFNALGTAMGFIINGYMYDVNIVPFTLYADMFPSFAHSATLQAAYNTALVYGVMFGLVIFGFIADFFGRKKGLVMCSCLVILGNIIGTAANGTSHEGMIWMQIIGLGVAGLGMGGEYTCNVPNITEDSDEVNVKNRGRRVSLLVIFMETIGNYLPFIIQLIIVAAACRNAYLGAVSGCKWQVVVRVTFGLAMLPAFIVLAYRLRMSDSLLFRQDMNRRNGKYDALDFYVILKHFSVRLVGTCISWWLFDWIAYTRGYFGNLILEVVIGASLFKSIWISLAQGAVFIWAPALAAFVVDKLGRRKTECLGWTSQAAGQLITAGFFYMLAKKPVAYIIWTTFVSFFNYFIYAPIYLLPAEVFPTRIRATLYGVSSALGKMGAVVGTTVFPTIWLTFGDGDENMAGLRRIQWLYAALMFVGALIALLFVAEYSGRGLRGEDERYEQLRKRYAARFAKWCGVSADTNQMNSNPTLWQVIVYRVKRGATSPEYLMLLKQYACVLLKRCALDIDNIDEYSSLPVHYNDLCLISKLYRIMRYGKASNSEIEKNSEMMASYEANRFQPQNTYKYSSDKEWNTL